MKIGGRIQEVKMKHKLNFNCSLHNLHILKNQIPQASKIAPNFNMGTYLQNIKDQHRIQTIKETTISIVYKMG